MKRILYIAISISLIFASASCTIEGPLYSEQGGIITILAQTERPADTKTHIGEMENGVRELLWSAGDSIGVTSNNGVMSKLVTKAGDSLFVGQLAGTLTAPYYSVYPYSANATVKDEILSITLPEIQTYKENTFSDKIMPMVSRSNEPKFSFKNLCGVLKLNIIGDKIVTKIVLTSDKPISGAGTVAMNYKDVPQLTMSSTSSKSITLDCTTNVQLSSSATPFYFVLPPDEHDMTIQVYTEDEDILTKKVSSKVIIKRSVIRQTSPLEVNWGDVFSLTPNEFEVSDKGDTISVEVTSNMEYSILSKPEWITEMTDASTKVAPTAKTHTFKVAFNTVGIKRTDTIIFCNVSDARIPVIVHQKGNDRAPLMALYNATGGPNWTDNTNWGTDKDLSQWKGITTDKEGNVTKIDLYNNNLSGSLPPEIGNLSKLYSLYLASNQLTGTIPPEVGNLKNLENLYLYGNELSGSIPVEIGNLTKLQYLWLGLNQLTGKIPSEICNLTNLKDLGLNSNKLTGTIPTKIGNLTKLETLSLSSNQLTGTIPSEIGNLTNLEKLRLDNNDLSGNIPSKIVNLTKLDYLALSGNQLTGTIPAEIGNLTNLKELWLSQNQFIGTVPSEIGNLTNLDRLGLGNNQLTGNIPSKIYDLKKLKYLNLCSNQFSGTIPSEICNLTTLQELILYNNKLTGSIPAEIGNLTNLEELWLFDNQLSGTIPISIGNLTNLKDLEIDENKFTGNIPSEIGNLVNLKKLFLDNNQLTGTIPTSIGNLTKLEWLSLGRNKLSGNIPAEVWKLTNLVNLFLGGNMLTGNIPAEIGNLMKLENLYLYANLFDSTIPSEIGNLTNLERLELVENQLTGTIPPEIGNLTKLEKLLLQENQLTGTIPAEIANIPELSDFQCQNNYLSTTFPDALKNHKYFSKWYLAPQKGGSNPNYYESTDYTYDGIVKQLLTHSIGKGIKIVITGDGFADRDFVASSTGQSHFDKLASIAVDEFFKEEPYKSFRDRFDVYSVAAVSKNDMIDRGGQTIFECKYGGGTLISGNNNKIFQYAAKAVGTSAISTTAILVMLNDAKYAGTCSIYTDGSAIAFVPFTYSDATEFGQTIRHECGHGFGKLADEYFYPGWGTAPTSLDSYLSIHHDMGWFKNVDVTRDSTEIIWSKYLYNDLYKGQVGIFEGANYYEYGVYRPTEKSIMHSNTGGFNAPSRESIYQRIMELSGEFYSWEKFLEYDKINRDAQSKATPSSISEKDMNFVPLAPPVIIEGTWRDAPTKYNRETPPIINLKR